MDSSAKSLITLLTFFLVILQCRADLLSKKTTVMINNLGHVDLIVHCKSKDDDLGVQTIHSGTFWSFSFKPNWFGGTDFYCKFQWSGSPQIYWFDIYEEKRDVHFCLDCHWSISPNASGPCRTSGETGESNCYEWNK